MAVKHTVLVGTVGYGIFRGENDGQDWVKLSVNDGLSFDLRTYYMASDPLNPQIVFAGTDQGIARSEDGGVRWKILDNALSKYAVWSIAIDPDEPEVMFAGTCPSGLFRSTDGGKTWEQRPVELATECAIGIPRVTAVTIDPNNRDHVWMAIEIDGFRRSLDRGDTWTELDVPNPDGHDIKFSTGEPRTVLVLANRNLYTSTDDGDTWDHTSVRDSFPYDFCRNMTVQPGHPQVVFMGHGQGSHAGTGMLLRSKDSGVTWDPIPLSPQPNSSMWTVAVHEADPNLMYANSLFGYLYRSEDGGDSWEKCWREFTEVRTLIWIPS
ncbi:MAG: hypothetical protein BZY88_16365 [SAR202 cluster bacterium Io17-Chloro-G9]|nr:MAG: hypothetical protein BZY88_16365 [SAR202 cluster bacterium Io17-Chloro-G9]